MKTFAVLALSAALLAGCSATPYDRGYGDSQLSPTKFRIDARVDGYSPRSRADDIAMLRAAEIACINGYEFFNVVEKKAWISGAITYSTITIEVQPANGEFDARFIMDSMKSKLDANTQCNFKD